MAGHHDPKLLYSIPNIKAYHIQNGEVQPLTPSGPQTLSLLMVPTNSAFADLSTTIPQNEAPDEDFYLHLNLPPELDLPMPATTQIYHQPPTSYLIPRWDLGPNSGAFTKIEFPPAGKGVTQEDIDTFETILAQCTAFLERARPPLPQRASQKGAYNPADYAPGGKYAGGGPDEKHVPGHIVLVDEDDGSVVGELGDGVQVVEDPALKHGSKQPVEVQISADGKRIEVSPISEDYLRMARHPAYKDSGLVQNAAAASRLIVTTTGHLSNLMTSGAETFQKKVTPNQKPMEFAPATHDRVRRINSLTHSVASTSSKTIGQAGAIVQNFTAKMAGHKKDRPAKGFDEKGNPLTSDQGYKPGLLNRSLIAFSTIGDGIAESGRSLLSSGAAAAGAVVGHKYGDEAGQIASQLAGGVKNVGLVYIDVTGVSRRAVIKSVAKGMVVGKVRGGGEVVVGGGDGGVIPEEVLAQGGGVRNEKTELNTATTSAGGSGFQPQSGPYEPVGFGNSAPPKYQEFGQKH